ncbi:MAG: DUF4115 domain-containing protein [Succinivibrio sp.]|nr:DUF4115 domain-containing protein [Succinivibrio sp.]
MSSKRLKGLRNRSHRNESLKELVRGYQEPRLSDIGTEQDVTAVSEQQEPSFDALSQKEETPVSVADEKLDNSLGLNPIGNASHDELSDPVQEQDENSASHSTNESAVSDDLPKISDDPDFVPIKPSLREDEVPNMPGAILKHAREMLGMSQREVATCLKLRVNTVSDIEHDRLNQPTAVPFASAHITAYAELVNVDAATLLKLYRRNVEEAVEASAKNSQPHEEGGHGWLVISIIVLLAVGAVTWWTLSSRSSSNSDSGALIVGETTDTQLQNDGSLVLDKENLKVESRNAADETAKSEKIEEQVVSQRTPVDENTLRARRQAAELGTNDIVNEMPKENSSAAGNQSRSQTERTTVLTTAESSRQGRREVRNEQAQNTKPDSRNSVSKNDADKSSSAQNDLAAAKESVAQNEPKGTDNSNTGTDKKTNDESPKTLAANLKDVSSSVKIVNRDGLASLNTVTVRVNGPVALKITDSRGKTLASGSYKSGDKVTVTGIPPLKVSVSDSAQVTVNYMGGRVNVPAQKQITYTLPTR